MHDQTDRLHLIRHGEVLNPDHVVYADLPGFGLSERGLRQAAAAAVRLAGRPVRRIVSSPLDRAVATAEAVARPHGLDVATDPRLTEWDLSSRWGGHRWPDLPAKFPGELEAYLADPATLPFSPESLTEVGARCVAAIEAAWSAGDGDVVIVSHQDPTEAARRTLTGRDFEHFHRSKPAHATIVTLARRGEAWRETMTFTPLQT